MPVTQLIALFACNLPVWIFAQATTALLPVYAVRLGADPAWAGFYLAFTFLVLTVGTLTTGWLSDRFQRRKAMLIAAGLVSIPCALLMGQVTTFWELTLLSAVVFFCVGVSFTTINIFVGLFAGENERGKVFGILAINNGLGTLIGGGLSGPIVDQFGFPALFLFGALCWAPTPLLALFLRDKVVAPRKPDSTSAALPPLGLKFYLFLLAHFFAFAAGFFAVLGRPLLMDQLKFDSTAITGVFAIGGAVAIPFPVVLGWLSDRFGRFWLIALCFAVAALGLAALSVSTELWHFWSSTILLASLGVSLGLSTAYVTDLVPPQDLGRALAWIGLTPTIGGVAGFAVTGFALQNFGPTTTFLAGALITVLAVALLIRVRPARRLAAGT